MNLQRNDSQESLIKRSQYEDMEIDAHSCRANSDGYGYCTVCGAVIHGSAADYDVHGYDPPETVRW